MPKRNVELPDLAQYASMAAAATAGAAVPYLLGYSGHELSLGTIGVSVLSGASSVASGVLTGRLGNVLHEDLNARLADPHTLLRNHHLHTLTAEAVAVVLQAAPNENPKLSPADEAKVGSLASAMRQEWDALSRIEGFQQQLLELSSEDLGKWFHDAQGGDAGNNAPHALTVEAWRIMLTAVNRKHACDLDVRVLTILAERLHWQMPLAIRELLEQGGPAFNGLLLMFLGEIHGVICEALPRQLETLADSQRDRQELEKLINSLYAVTSELTKRLDFLPRDDSISTDTQPQLDRWEALQAAVHQLGTENQQSHYQTHDMLAEVRELLSNLASGSSLPLDSLFLGNAFRNPIRIGAAKGLVARKGERQKLKKILLGKKEKGQGSVVYIHGMPGVGKSYLVEWFATKPWTDQHGTNTEVTYLTLRVGDDQPSTTKDDILRDLCDHFKIPFSDSDIWERLDNMLSMKGRLLVVENVDEAAAMQVVAQVVHRLPKSTTIISGRVVTSGDASGWSIVPLSPFDLEDGLRQLKKELGRRVTEFREDELRTLVSSLGGLPLALHLAAGHLLEGMSPSEFLRELRGSGFDLQPADLADPRLAQDASRAILSASFEISWNAFRRLPGEQAARWVPALAALGYAPLTGFGTSLGSAIAGLEEDEFPRFCRTARRLSILDIVPNAARSGSVHRLYPLWAELLQRRTDAEQVVNRIQDWFTDRFPPPRDGDATNWIAINEEHNALTDWLERVPDLLAVPFALKGIHYAIRNGPFAAWNATFQRALRLTDHLAKRSCLLWGLANVAIHSGDLNIALRSAEEKLAIDIERKDECGQALAQDKIADVLMAQGELDEALRIRRVEVLPVFERWGVERWRAVTQGKIADVLMVRGELDEALRIFRVEQLPVYERLGDTRELAMTQGKIADVLVARGELDEALWIRREAELPVYEQLGDVHLCAVTQGQIADVLMAQGDWDEALRIHREEGLPVYQRLGDVHSYAATQGKIADVLLARGDLGEALRIRREEELPIYESRGDVRSLAITQGKIADILMAQGELDEALQIRREKELPVYERLRDVRLHATTQGKIADVLVAQGNLEEALWIYRNKLLPVFERLENIRLYAVTQQKIASVLMITGDLDEALRIYREEALPVYERLGDIRSFAVAQGKIADVLMSRGEWKEALRIFREEELPVYEQLGDVRSMAVVQGKIADVLVARGERNQALRIYREEQLPVYELLGDVRSLAMAQGKIADVLVAQGEVEESLRIRREEELPVYERLGDIREFARTQCKIADILMGRGELDEALRIYREEQLPVFERLGDVQSIAMTKCRIADVLMARGDLDESLRIYRKDLLPVFERLGEVRSYAVTQGRIADVLTARGDLVEALRIRREEELPVFQSLGDLRELALTQCKIADVLKTQGELDEELRIYREEQLPVFERLGDKRSLLVGRINMAITLLTRNVAADRKEAQELLRNAFDEAKRLNLPEADRVREIQAHYGLTY